MCLYVRGKEQKRLEKEDYIQQLGKPKYKVGEEVCFVYGKDRDQEAKGRICIIDAYGTWKQLYHLRLGGKAVFNIAGKRYSCFILEKFII